MKIVESHKYKIKLEKLAEYIAKDKKSAAKKFLKELKIKVNNLTKFPYMCRKSFYFNDENYRDLIFKGYTIIYKIEEDKIIILDIFKGETW